MDCTMFVVILSIERSYGIPLFYCLSRCGYDTQLIAAAEHHIISAPPLLSYTSCVVGSSTDYTLFRFREPPPPVSFLFPLSPRSIDDIISSIIPSTSLDFNCSFPVHRLRYTSPLRTNNASTRFISSTNRSLSLIFRSLAKINSLMFNGTGLSILSLRSLPVLLFYFVIPSTLPLISLYALAFLNNQLRRRLFYGLQHSCAMIHKSQKTSPISPSSTLDSTLISRLFLASLHHPVYLTQRIRRDDHRQEPQAARRPVRSADSVNQGRR